MDLLDESKENIQPLKRGRNMSTLNTALQAQTDGDIYRQLKKEREEYEILLRSYSGDDPLKPWYDYVQWIEQNFPKHGKDGNLKMLLENCLGEFKDSENYSQDMRYIDLWTRYMQFADNPLEIYKQIHARGIGTNCSIFYQCWAEEYEMANDMKRADQIYIEGIKRNAQPIEELKAAHNDFQVRVARGILGQNPLAYQELQLEGRTALSILRAHGRKRNMVDSSRVGNSIKLATPGVLRPHSNSLVADKRNGNCQQKIAVFNDENAGFFDAVASTQMKPTVSIKREQVNKENTLQPGRWNEGKFKKKSSAVCSEINIPAASKVPSFHVHVDENMNAPSTPSTDLGVSNVLKVRKHIYDDEKNIPIAITEPPDPSKKAMYPKSKVYSGGTEFSLEELRAIIYNKRLQNRKSSREKISDVPVSVHKLACEEADAENEECMHVNQFITPESKCNSNSDNYGKTVVNNDEADKIQIVKGSFEVFVDEEEIDSECRQVMPLQETSFKVKKPVPPVLPTPKELPFSGGVDLKVVKLLKERKASDCSDSFCPSLSGNKDFDQSLTVNTKAVLKEVKDMWVSSPPLGSSKFLEVRHPERSMIDGGNGDKSDTKPVSLHNGLIPFRIFSEQSDLEQSSRINVYDSGDNFKKADNKQNISPTKEVFNNKTSGSRTMEKVVGPVQESVQRPVNEFSIYADSFVERRPGQEIPYVASPGMTPVQLAAMDGTEDKENYQGSRKHLCFSTDKSKKNVLEPSKEIYFLPLSERNTVEDMEEDNKLSDETCCTEAFAKPLVSSTPLIHPLIKYGGTGQEKMDIPEDDTISLMNIHREKIVSKQRDLMPVKNCGENNVDNVASQPIIPQNTSVVEQQNRLSIIYEISEHKKSLSSGENSALKASGFESHQKFKCGGKISSDLIRVPEVEDDFRNLTLHFNSFTKERNPNNTSEPTKIVKFFSDNFRDICLKRTNFPNKKHYQYCKRVAEQWNVHNIDVGRGVYVNRELIILQDLSTSSDTYLWKAFDQAANEVVVIKTESLSLLWEYYIKEEIRLRMKDSSLVNLFVREDQTYIYNNSIVTISSSRNYKKLEDILVECNSNDGYVMSELNALCFACNMIKIIHHLHMCKIVHGNISIHSFLINSVPETEDGCMVLNDFGYAVDTTLLAPNTLFDATEKTIFKECNACNVSPYKVDYIGLVNALHHLIFNKPVEVFEHLGLQHIYTDLPRNFSGLWSILFEELLNSPEVNLLEHYTTMSRYVKSSTGVNPDGKLLSFLSSTSM